MSAFGPKWTSLAAPHMSAFGDKADMWCYSRLDLDTPKTAALREITLHYEERICFAVALPPPNLFENVIIFTPF